MVDVTGTTTTTTMWQDNHSGLRRHKLMTKELGEKIPALYANENAPDYDSRRRPREAVLSVCRLDLVRDGVESADRASASAWSRGSRMELGYFDLTEMAEAKVRGVVPAIERDLYWKPTTLGEIKRESHGRMAA